MYLETEDIETNRVNGTSNPDWNFSKQFSYTPATEQVSLVCTNNTGSHNKRLWFSSKFLVNFLKMMSKYNRKY